MLPKIKPCRKCGDVGDPVLYVYEPGYKGVECFECCQLGPASGNKKSAIQLWNDRQAAGDAS